MTRAPIVAILALVALLVGGGATPRLHAQEAVWVRERAPAWLGIGYDVRWLQRGQQCEPRVVVESVVHGSPAERAGLRPGDALLAVDGTPAPGRRLQALSARLLPGDSVRLRFERDGAVREVTAVADRRPARPPTAVTMPPGQDGLARTTAPVVRVRGDTIEAWNLERSDWGGASARGYWLASADGGAEYRRLRAWSGDDVDQRVRELLVCADTLRRAAGGDAAEWAPGAPGTAVRVEVRRIRERADSLRVVMARRALEAAGDQERLVVREAPYPAAGVFRFGDHVAVGLRAVAGAELTALEPELAEYFRNVRKGLLVLQVADGSPAARAGLRPGDVITRADRRAVESVDELRRVLERHERGGIELEVVRHGRDRSLTLRYD